MKVFLNKILWMVLPLLAVLTGCADVDLDQTAPKQNATEINSVINEEEALAIASQVVGYSETRTEELGLPSIQYLSTNQCTRSGGVSGVDTIAYIINYDGDTGFAIISKKRIRKPVLAYSQTGRFSTDNEIARENFLELVPYYTKNTEGIGSTDWIILPPPGSQGGSCCRIHPKLQFNLDQISPWNKYVLANEKGGPYVGCGAVALGYALTHHKDEVSFHGVTYDMAGLRESLHIYEYGENSVGYEGKIAKYTKTWSEDAIAKILWQIGKDANATYTDSGTSIPLSNIYYFCVNNGMTVGAKNIPYDSISVVKDIIRENLILMYGRNTNRPSAHEWVVDGCDYCTYPDGSYFNLYLHCNWGWSGHSNGYFSGDIFTPYSGRSYEPTSYFTVQIGTPKLQPVI